LTWLTGNATHDAFLFVEQVFQLVESAECALEQISTGVRLLEVRHCVRAHLISVAQCLILCVFPNLQRACNLNISTVLCRLEWPRLSGIGPGTMPADPTGPASHTQVG
jgi:hypothetical protein